MFFLVWVCGFWVWFLVKKETKKNAFHDRYRDDACVGVFVRGVFVRSTHLT